MFQFHRWTTSKLFELFHAAPSRSDSAASNSLFPCQKKARKNAASFERPDSADAKQACYNRLLFVCVSRIRQLTRQVCLCRSGEVCGPLECCPLAADDEEKGIFINRTDLWIPVLAHVFYLSVARLSAGISSGAKETCWLSRDTPNRLISFQN